jgi:ADP-ribose pyrophosphatase YjhB (NUDIX family)
MNTQRPDVGVNVALFNAQGEVLLGLRRGAHESTLWGYPGGKVEFGERLIDAAIREVKEETGISIHDLELISVVDDLPGEHTSDKHFVTVGFKAMLPAGAEPSIMEPSKCREWRWFALDALPDTLFAPTQRALNNLTHNIVYKGF